MNSKENIGSLCAISSGFLYGFIAYFGLSVTHADMSVSTMLFWRFCLASFIMMPLFLLQLRRCTDSLREMAIAFFNGAIFYGLSTLLYFFSSQYLGSGLAMVIFFSYPAIVMLINFFVYGESISAMHYAAIVTILFGMFFLVDMRDLSMDLTGICLGLASALFFACYMILSKKRQISPNSSTMMVSLGCMSSCWVLTCFDGSFSMPISSFVWLNLWGIAVIATIIPLLLLLHSMKYISAEKASILSVLEPVFVVIFGVVLLGEQLLFRHTVGILVILLGALLALVNDLPAFLKPASAAPNLAR